MSDDLVMEEYAQDFESRQRRATQALARLEEKIDKARQTLGETTEDIEKKVSDALTDDILEEFVDAILSTMVTLSDRGLMPEVETVPEVRTALLAVVRKLYLKKSVLTMMSSKFARYGAERLLRAQRMKISKSI